MKFEKRYLGELPKIGIRPAIDGRRRGVRESLEETTMNLARATAKLLSGQLRHPSGQAVECVIADSCIGGVAEAAACADKFRRENVGVSITVTPCWCYGTETMDTDRFTPKAVWGFNGTERPGAVYLAAVMAAHAQKGIPAFGIYGRDVCDIGDMNIPDDVAEKLLRFAKAGLAVATMRDKSYLSMGSVAMGIAGSIIDDKFFADYLGMRNEYIDMVEFSRRIDLGIYDPDEYKRALAWVKENCAEDEDFNSEWRRTREQKDSDWEFVVKMAMIARDLMIGNPRLAELGFEEEANGHNAIAAGFQGQRQWTDYMPNGDFMEAMLNSSFDWNGLREAFVVATENDGLNGAAMLFGHLLTDTASGFADVRTYWSPEAVKRVTDWTPEGDAAGGFIHLINSGAAALDAAGKVKDKNGIPMMKPFWDMTEAEARSCLDATKWGPANAGYFRGGGFSSTFLTEGKMPMTMSRINLIKGLGPVLQIAEGWSVDLPENVFDILNKRTDRTWPSTWFVPRLTGEGAFADVYSVMNNWGANHGAFNYGHIGADMITLASMLRIPVCMHNVSEDKIFRPNAWNAFGMDSEGSDYRACQNFGALYK